MRPSHIEARLEQQYALTDLISNSLDNLTIVGLNNLSPTRIQFRIAALKENWERFSIVHDAIEISIRKLSNEDKIRIQSHSYFMENLFTTTHEIYLDSIERMGLLLESDQGTNSGVSTHSQGALNIPTCSHRTRLPRLDLPKFNGSPADWLNFKDLFYSMVITDNSLSAVEKLQYLKISLIGSAAHHLKNTRTTGDNFQKAWNALIAFYENKRGLVNSALHSLFNLKRLTKDSAQEMEKLYTSIDEIYRSLETLQRPVSTWDDILVFIAVQRLDPESVKLWEHHLGASPEPPSWVQFKDFLFTRLRSIQAVEKNKLGKIKQDPGLLTAKAHFQGKPKRINSNSTYSCILCKDNHFVTACSQYTSKTVQQRRVLVERYKLCYNCLGSHRVTNCRVTRRCLKCGGRHHTTIHLADTTKNKGEVNTSVKPIAASSTTSEAKVLHSTINPPPTTSCVLLATAQVRVITANGNTSKVRALIDQGSEVSLISERLAQRLRMPRFNTTITLIGVGAQHSNKSKGRVVFKLKPHFDSEFECSITAHILPKLTTLLPSEQIIQQTWPHLQGLQLADPHFLSPGRIDLILGADAYGQFIDAGLIHGEEGTPLAQSTYLGWIISGPASNHLPIGNVQGYHVTSKDDLHQLIQRFWEMEEVPNNSDSSLSAEDQQCEDHYKATFKRDLQGRYTVRLPFKTSVETLGNSKAKAVRLLAKLTTRLQTDTTFSQLYTEFITDYVKSQHMVQVPDSQTEPDHAYYLPHHGVWKESSLTTKLRVVFNGSSPTSTGISLNELLYTGERLQANLFDVLIWFRQFCYVFSTDIEKMFRQIRIHADDCKYQRILWSDERNHIQTFELTTVTYGLACAPFLALRTLLQLSQDEGNNYPFAIPTFTRGRYVDDIFGGADSIEQAQVVAQQLNQLCMAGGFPLRKWASNQPSVLASIPVQDQLPASTINIEDNLIIHSLGLSWVPASDTFHFHWNMTSTRNLTKRIVLSTIAKFFDPLGLLSPLIIKAKIFVQELWTIKLDWDDPLPPSTSDKWNEFIDKFQDTNKLSFPRWLGLKSNYTIQLHGFCDASQNAMAAVVYTRSISEDGTVFTQLVCSKTKVAPLKRMTIPRLELSGAVLLTKLILQVSKVLNRDNLPIYLRTDSSITYMWINNHPSRWKEFVHNRVCFIQETLPQARWGLVPGNENPADYATRGVTPNQLCELSSWWTGPIWLRQSEDNWPHRTQQPSSQINFEERPVIVTVNQTSEETWDLLHRYSSLTRLLRITAVCQRVIQRMKRVHYSSLATPITTVELENARNFWIKTIQRAAFPQELDNLVKKIPLAKSNPLIRLTPFIDSEGILRVGGRLHASSLSTTAKHPAILPKISTFTTLVILDAHLRTLHGGTQVTMTYIRHSFWIIGGRTPIRSHIIKCVRCSRFRQKRAQQLMGQLPPEKLTPSRAFINSGIDYAGPFNLKTWRGRNARTYKGYFVIFVCLSTSAVHLELVTDYTTEGFIAAFKRFTGRRGICATLMSDCGSNLKGADAELQRLFSSSSKEAKHMATLLAQDGTQWKFNPPSAPHFGGKWEAGVKSVKHHLKRVVGDSLLTYEELSTLLTQIEAVLNSRPICPLTEDSEDLEVLTPGHFIMGCAPTIVPEPSLQETKSTRLSRWQLIRKMLECFWNRWSTECLQRYLSIYKWNTVTPPLKEGSMVLVVDERYPPSKWPLGRIIKTHPGRDGLIRVVTIRTQTSVLKRPIVKVCPLPIDSETI